MPGGSSGLAARREERRAAPACQFRPRMRRSRTRPHSARPSASTSGACSCKKIIVSRAECPLMKAYDLRHLSIPRPGVAPCGQRHRGPADSVSPSGNKMQQTAGHAGQRGHATKFRILAQGGGRSSNSGQDRYRLAITRSRCPTRRASRSKIETKPEEIGTAGTTDRNARPV